jgi:hypothetical protein
MHNGHAHEVTKKLDLAKLAMSACVHPSLLLFSIVFAASVRTQLERFPNGMPERKAEE